MNRGYFFEHLGDLWVAFFHAQLCTSVSPLRHTVVYDVHMNPHEEQLARVEQKLDAVYASTEKTRKYILIMLTATLVMAVLPIILGAIMLPMLTSTLGSVYGI